MKLTNMIRDAFIRAAMDDVPSVDYDEQIRAIVLSQAAEALPPKVRAVYDDKNLRTWVTTDWERFGGLSVTYPSAGRTLALDTSSRAKIAELEAAKKSQSATRSKLKDKLHACAYSVTTRKALVDLLPEFEKYLPADQAAASRTLPVVANVVADFVQAGWPKGKAPA